MREEPEDLLCGRPVGLALLGVDRKLGDTGALHSLSQLALDEGLHQQRDEIETYLFTASRHCGTELGCPARRDRRDLAGGVWTIGLDIGSA